MDFFNHIVILSLTLDYSSHSCKVCVGLPKENVTKKGRVKQQHDPSVEPIETECGWVSIYQTGSMTMALI
jgi:hypothetical protein